MGTSIITLPLWASAGSRVDPGAGKVSVGWVASERPAMEWENYLVYETRDRINDIISYLNTGVPLDDLIDGDMSIARSGVNTLFMSPAILSFDSLSNDDYAQIEVDSVKVANDTETKAAEITKNEISILEGSLSSSITPAGLNHEGYGDHNIQGLKFFPFDIAAVTWVSLGNDDYSAVIPSGITVPNYVINSSYSVLVSQTFKTQQVATGQSLTFTANIKWYNYIPTSSMIITMIEIHSNTIDLSSDIVGGSLLLCVADSAWV